MVSRTLEDEIDRLYQGPLAEFTAARNALAKRSGGEAARIRALVKPPVAIWAVNQLYWREREVWNALTSAAEETRRVHKKALSGTAADIRAVNKVHDEAVEQALKGTLGLLAGAGHPASDATRQAVLTTLRALPSDEAPGRLTEPLQPRGFEALAGLSIGRGAGAVTTRAAAKRPPAHRPTPGRTSHADARAAARAQADAASAARQLRDAEQAVRREEFEATRAARDETRVAKAAADAKDALARAQADLERAQTDLASAVRAREAADRRARDARQALDRLRPRR